MSAIGTKQTLPSALHMSAFGGKADIVGGIRQCPLLTRSKLGHVGELDPDQCNPPTWTEISNTFRSGGDFSYLIK